MKSLITLASLVAVAGIASAQAPATEKKVAPAPKPVPADKAPTESMQQPPAVEAPKPPPEVAAVAKVYAGNWKCAGTGKGMDGTELKLAVKLSTKVDLDKWWLVDTITVTMGKMTEKQVVYSTYDAKSAKWRRVGVSNGGAQMVGTSDGFKDNKMVFTMDIMSPQGSYTMRESSDMTNPKAAVFKGEMSMDKGKTYNALWEVTCKK